MDVARSLPLRQEDSHERSIPETSIVRKPMLLTAVEVAEELRASRSYVYRLLQEGHLPKVTIGRSVRVPRDALEEWIRARTEEAIEL